MCQHLKDHLKQLPDEDRKTRLILQQMLEDEKRQATMHWRPAALDAGLHRVSKTGERCHDSRFESHDADGLPRLADKVSGSLH